MSGSLVQEAALAKCSFGTEAPVEEILAMLRFLGVCHGCIGTEAESQVQTNREMRKIVPRIPRIFAPRGGKDLHHVIWLGIPLRHFGCTLHTLLLRVLHDWRRILYLQVKCRWSYMAVFSI